MSAAEAYADLLVDPGEIRRHVEIIHRAAARAAEGIRDPGLLQMSRLNPSDAEPRTEVIGRYAIGETERMAADAEREAMAGRNVYVEGRTVRKGLPADARGVTEDTVLVFALVADMDGYRGKAAPARGEPTIVQSSPGNAHHWYFFDRGLPFTEAKALGKAMRAGCGGDSASGNLTQPYRVAGTPNYPTADKRKRFGKIDEPTKVLAVSARVYTADAFSALWPPVEPDAAPTDDADEGDDEADFDVLLARCSPRLRERFVQDDVKDRSGHFHNVTGFIRREGFTKAQAVILWEGHPGSYPDRYDGRLEAEVDRSWGKVKDRPRKPQSNDIITEDNAAAQFAERYGDQLRFDHDIGAWFEWDGAHWQKTTPGRAFHWARKLAREMAENEDPKVRFIAGKAGFAGSVEKFARSDEVFAVTGRVWDRDPWLLGTPAGTVELRTGHMREPEPFEGITRLTRVAPAATPHCPRWVAFLDETTGQDAALVRFLKQWAGYCLTGVTTEHALLFAHGPGRNGKSVFLNTLRRILDGYAATAAMETFVSAKFGSHPTDLAMLRGARLVTASETEEGRAWAEARIKSITGGDPITARFMRQDFFTYEPQFKLTIVGNHKPVLRNVDEAARRRFNIVPFNRQPKVVDRQLEEKLADEMPGILRWMIEGCLDWQAHGLVRPAAVVEETDAYFAEQDVFSQWFADSCQTGNPMSFTTTRELFGAWSIYARHAGEEIGTERTFASQMARKGLVVVRTNKGRGYRSVALTLDEVMP